MSENFVSEKEGWLWKKTTRDRRWAGHKDEDWQRLYFRVLKTGASFSSSKASGSVSGVVPFQRIFRIDPYIDLEDGGYCFIIRTIQRENITLRADNEIERDSWLNAINERKEFFSDISPDAHDPLMKSLRGKLSQRASQGKYS